MDEVFERIDPDARHLVVPVLVHRHACLGRIPAHLRVRLTIGLADGDLISVYLDMEFSDYLLLEEPEEVS